MRRLLEEPGLRARQLDHEGRVVGRIHAHLVLERVAVVLLGIAAVVLLRPDDAVELVRVVGAELGRDGPLPRVLEVLGGDRVAVRPLEPVAEVIGDGLAVVARLEALGGGADRVQVLVELDERIHDVEQDVGGGDVGRQTGVERGRLGTPVHRDHLLGGLGAAGRRAGAGSLVVVAAAAGRDQGETRDEQRRATARGSSSSSGRSFLRLHECSGAGSTPSWVLAMYTVRKPVKRWSLRTVNVSATLAALGMAVLAQPALAHLVIRPTLLEQGVVTDVRIELPQLRPGRPPASSRSRATGST